MNKRSLIFLVIFAFSILFSNVMADPDQATDQEQRMQQLEKLVHEQNQRIQQLEKQLQGNSSDFDVEKVVREQQQKIDDLQKQLKDQSTRGEKYTESIVRQYINEANTEDVAIQYGYDGGFFVQSADGNFQLHLTGFAQAGLGIFENDTFDNNGVFLNGVYLTMDTYLYEQWLIRIQIDFSSTRAFGDGLFNFNDGDVIEPRLRDVFVEYNAIPEFQVRVGQTHVPFTIEGQYAEKDGLSIFAEPFITSWAHGRDLGIMFKGVLADVLEYRASIHNGEGENVTNRTDDVLLASQLRIYPLGYSENPNTFFHIGALRNRDNRLKNDGDFGSATLFSPWARRLYGDNLNLNNGNLAQTQGWQTAVDIGGRVDSGNLRVEGEFMFFEWERDLDTFGRLGRIYGIGASLGALYKINLSGQEDGSGLLPMLKLSYTDLENYDSDNVNSQINGQTVITYTLGIGYAFNDHIAVNINWIMLDVFRADVNGPKDDVDTTDDIEHGWFVQVTGAW